MRKCWPAQAAIDPSLQLRVSLSNIADGERICSFIFLCTFRTNSGIFLSKLGAAARFRMCKLGIFGKHLKRHGSFLATWHEGGMAAPGR